MEYEPVIGLEVHVQLNTQTKMFSRAPYKYGQAPNTLTDPLVLGLPGTLPVINKAAIDKTIKAGLMFNCKIADICKWDRKNYYYPDLPKGYQISQYDQPLCLGGEVEIELPGPSRNIMGDHRKVQLTRIHLEEDAGKLTHSKNDSLVDLNRAGASLIEIVTEPDLFSTEEVVAFLTSLRIHMLYAGLSDCDMEKGQMRCDANISLRPKGSKTLGTKVEIKNLNSISGVKNGVHYEIKRQTRLLESGKTIVQETRKWDAEKQMSLPMRSKEEAHDYRYFPDPDLMPVKISLEMQKEIQTTLPELPFAKQERMIKDYALPYTITSVLYPDLRLSNYFEATLKIYKNPKGIANFLVNDILRELSLHHQTIKECTISPDNLATLVKYIDEGTISKQTGQDILVEMFHTGTTAEEIIDQKGLKQTSDTSELEKICKDTIATNPKPVEQYRAGKENAINALKGQVMKATKGKANPKVIDELLKNLLNS